ncbi:MAG: restriction endonuclease subunit S [Nanoarchaeota archaeon]|nr:restriction endonuclease subunit S [Nanoarchaeota archaeon]
MAVESIVNLSKLEGSTRLDAEFYRPIYLKIRQKILKKPYVKMGGIVETCRKGIFDIKAEKYTSSGIPFVRISNLRNGLINDDDMAFIPPEIHRKEINTELNKLDLVLSKTAYPAASLIFYDKCNISQDIIGISLNKYWKDKMIAPYIVAFLNTKYGIAEMQQWFQGNIQMHLALPDVRRILIPIIPLNVQKNISKTFFMAHEQMECSKSVYRQAEKLLLEETGLDEFKLNFKLSYSCDLSKAFNFHRVDAEYFQPAFDKLINKIKDYQNGCVKLLKFVEGVKKDFDPARYPDKIFSYVELADIDAAIGLIRRKSKIRGEEAPSRARRLLKKNDVIVSSVEGSLAKVALVDDEHDACLASTGFFQFRPTKILPEVLLVLSKSIVLQAQLKKECSGTILTAVPNESVKRILIPILPDKTQKRIASLVQKSHEARKKAKELLEEAKRKVEQAIES